MLAVFVSDETVLCEYPRQLVYHIQRELLKKLYFIAARDNSDLNICSNEFF